LMMGVFHYLSYESHNIVICSAVVVIILIIQQRVVNKRKSK
jgi:ABC-type siderophore export system fused ATPase/permease subunit